MSGWIVGFLTGTLMGRISAWPVVVQWTSPVFGGVMIAAACLVRRVPKNGRLRRAGAGFFVVAGLLWGLGHSAPLPMSSHEGARMVKREPVSPRRAPAIVRADDQWFLVRGRASVGAVGKVSPRRRTPGPFETHRPLFRSRYQPPLDAATSSWTDLVEHTRAVILSRLESTPGHLRGWLESVLLGKRDRLEPWLRKAFRVTGTYHLLVVSGLHLSLVAYGASLTLRLPLRFFYAVRLMTPFAFRHAGSAAEILCIGAAAAYAAVVGCPVSAQRAVLIFALIRLSKSFGPASDGAKLKAAFCSQTFLFPMGVLSPATLLSWGAYLFVREAFAKPKGVRRVRSLVAMQTRIACLVGAVFGQLSWMGIVFNLVVGPVFPIVFACAVLAVFFPHARFWAPPIEWFLATVETAAALVDRWPLLYWSQENVLLPGRWLLAALSATSLLSTLSRQLANTKGKN